MSENNPIRIFVVHGWIPDDDYLRIIEYLESAQGFFYVNLSKPEEAVPGGDGQAARRTAIEQALKQAECVICSAGIWDRYNEWARFAVEAAKRKELPVVVIEHFGPKELDLRLKGHADSIVGWDSRSLVDAVKLQARHEETARFDVIEFDL